ncbi:MAG TPA: FecR family protein, partial [Smithellaceae bacterium]|nr:FecR family protein [Smithellaceae bacterium]
MKAKDCVGIIFVILLLLPWMALAVPVGKITNLHGNVDITSAGKTARIARLGDGVNVGDFIRSKSKSKVEITFNEGNVLRLGENSRVGITRYMSGEKQNSSIINLFRGKIHNIIKSVGADGRYEVHTPVSVCGVRGTRFFNYFLSGASGSIFEEGSGYGYSKKDPADVKKINSGQGMFVPDAKSGAKVRIVPDHQLDEMKKATDVLESSDDSADASGILGDLASGDEVPILPLPLPSPLVPAYTPPIVIPPLIQTALSSDLELSAVAGDVSFSRTIDNVIIKGTSLDYGSTFALTASGAGITSAYDPAGGLIKGLLS